MWRDKLGNPSRNQQDGGTRRNQEEPGGTRTNQEKGFCSQEKKGKVGRQAGNSSPNPKEPANLGGTKVVSFEELIHLFRFKAVWGKTRPAHRKIFI